MVHSASLIVRLRLELTTGTVVAPTAIDMTAPDSPSIVSAKASSEDRTTTVCCVLGEGCGRTWLETKMGVTMVIAAAVKTPAREQRVLCGHMCVCGSSGRVVVVIRSDQNQIKPDQTDLMDLIRLT